MQSKWFRRLVIAAAWCLFLFRVAPVVAAKPSKEAVKPNQDLATQTDESAKRKTFREEMQSLTPIQRKQMELGIGAQLHQLFYPGFEDFGRAVKMFQKDLGAEPTGEITEEQLQELGQRAERVNVPDIYFPTVFSSTDVKLMQKQGFATVRGTAVILADDESIAFPINHVHITCYKGEKYCELRENYLAVLPTRGGGYTWTFDERTSLFDIISWTDDSIEAKESDDPTQVRISSLSLNFKTKEFFWITKNSGNDTNLITGEKVEPLKKPRIAQFVKGDKIVADYFKKLNSDARFFRSSEFRKKVEVLAQEK